MRRTYGATDETMEQYIKDHDEAVQQMLDGRGYRVIGVSSDIQSMLSVTHISLCIAIVEAAGRRSRHLLRRHPRHRLYYPHVGWWDGPQ